MGKIKGKIIAKLIVSILEVLICTIQLITSVICLIFGIGGSGSFIALFIPQIASLPLLAASIVDLIILAGSVSDKERQIRYRQINNVLMGILSAVLLVFWGFACLLSGTVNFFLGAMAEGYGDTIYMVGFGMGYTMILPGICFVLLIAQTVISILIAREK